MQEVSRRLLSVAIVASVAAASGSLVTEAAFADSTRARPARMLVGIHADNWAGDNGTMGPLRAERVFYPGALPQSFAGSKAAKYPANVVVYVSYKKRGNAAKFARSIPSGRRIRLIYHHEPENDYGGNGAAFVKEFKAEYRAVKKANPKVQMGMAAMTYQYAHGRAGQSGSFLPPASSVDFYAADNYEAKILPKGLAGDPEFQGWYKLVKNRGKELELTEYGVGATDLKASGTQRAAVIRRDDAWLTGNGRFGSWLYWYKNGTNHDWRFTDSASVKAWRAVARKHNLGAYPGASPSTADPKPTASPTATRTTSATPRATGSPRPSATPKATGDPRPSATSPSATSGATSQPASPPTAASGTHHPAAHGHAYPSWSRGHPVPWWQDVSYWQGWTRTGWRFGWS